MLKIILTRTTIDYAVMDEVEEVQAELPSPHSGNGEEGQRGDEG